MHPAFKSYRCYSVVILNINAYKNHVIFKIAANQQKIDILQN